jgi:hypothetical protein
MFGTFTDEADPGAAKARVKRWQQENADRVNAYWRARRQEPEVKRRDRARHLKRKFGITLEQYDELLARQGGVCSLCQRPPSSSSSRHVDHDHETGQIRGPLCFRCNNALGDFDDDPMLLRMAARYVEPPDRRDLRVERRLEELRRMTPAWDAS